MRHLFFIPLFISVFLFSCGSSDNVEQGNDKVMPQDSATSAPVANFTSKEGKLADGIVNKYLTLKDALVNDDPVKARVCGQQFIETMKTLANQVPAEIQSLFTPLKDTLQMHITAIANEKDIAVQREHFKFVSNVVFELVMNLGTKEKLYKLQCPMDNSEWLSKEEAIRNPYQGKAMLECGNVQATIN